MEIPNLRYVSSSSPGFIRKRKGKGFYYLDDKGERIRDEKILERIEKLVIPPAWENVWICPYATGHLQATGIDTKGRKQYIYHPRWRKAREETKYGNLLQFGKNLPLIRRQVRKDLRKKTLQKEKVTAIALAVMEETLIRVGNTYYANEYGSHGLTTLRNKHVSINGNTISFRFRGKKGVLHEISYRDRKLALLVKKIKELPGQDLFQYYDQNGTLQNLGSGDINEYLSNCTQCNFTSKDYRTWAGTLHALKEMAECPDFTTKEECEKNIVRIIDKVAAKLGNTRAVCRKYYIYPPLLEAYKRKQLSRFLKALRKTSNSPEKFLKNEERIMLRLLKSNK
ncbi:MAG TPA: DNA topoisomerase IB [Anseongella sp.]|nr:DNA topoisomerase IB [Anseongella sp.]